MNQSFENFESDAMTRIIAENPNLSDKLTRQYSSAKVVSREFTGVGFFTDFEVMDKESKLDDCANLQLGNVQAKIKGIEFGAGFVLFIKDGFIKLLECYTYGEPLPAQIFEYSFEVDSPQ